MNIDFNKSGGLVPVIIQDDISLQVLMLGYMNEAALEQTKHEGLVTFFSRSRNKLWTKGATSGNYLQVKEICQDCDHDTLLIKVKALGPTCHNGTTACFGESSVKGFLYQLEDTIARRIDDNDTASYTNQLYRKGLNKVAQKVGEEAVELIIEAKDNDAALFHNEAADLLYHFLILLKAKDTSLSAVEKVLQLRNQKKK
ncbi:MAG: bifunctional phosphoribosyl-AMP cyclohydrolase/phosphoribosyl-ATP diphosphatase HisIE [Taibaiella sp.]|jgi:phosphoribosyl-ATP pyrophosphohydrolase/phosphoribosyl-AMP cyclohydrolase